MRRVSGRVEREPLSLSLRRDVYESCLVCLEYGVTPLVCLPSLTPAHSNISIQNGLLTIVLNLLFSIPTHLQNTGLYVLSEGACIDQHHTNFWPSLNARARALPERSHNLYKAMSGLIFVTTDGSAKVSASQRRLIRSHCMREKNKQPQSRRSRREARKLQAVVKEDRRASGVEPAHSDASEKQEQEQKQQKQVLNEDLALAPVVGIPPPPPSDWALIKFPVETDRTSQMLFHQV